MTASASSDGAKRCPWPERNPLYIAYHDEEWGVPEYDDRALYEKLVLDGFRPSRTPGSSSCASAKISAAPSTALHRKNRALPASGKDSFGETAHRPEPSRRRPAADLENFFDAVLVGAGLVAGQNVIDAPEVVRALDDLQAAVFARGRIDGDESAGEQTGTARRSDTSSRSPDAMPRRRRPWRPS